MYKAGVPFEANYDHIAAHLIGIARVDGFKALNTEISSLIDRYNPDLVELSKRKIEPKPQYLMLAKLEMELSLTSLIKEVYEVRATKK